MLNANVSKAELNKCTMLMICMHYVQALGTPLCKFKCFLNKKYTFYNLINCAAALIFLSLNHVCWSCGILKINAVFKVHKISAQLNFFFF